MTQDGIAEQTQKYKRIDVNRYNSYDEANAAAKQVFFSLTGINTSSSFTSESHKVRIKLRKQSNFFDVISYVNMNYQVPTAQDPEVVQRVRKGGKKDRKRKQELTSS